MKISLESRELWKQMCMTTMETAVIAVMGVFLLVGLIWLAHLVFPIIFSHF